MTATADADVAGLAEVLARSDGFDWEDDRQFARLYGGEDNRADYRRNARAAIAYLTPIIRERCAKVAEAEKTSGETNTHSEASYNMACDHIAAAIRIGE